MSDRPKYVPGLLRVEEGRYGGSGVPYDDYSEDYTPYNPRRFRREGCDLPNDDALEDEEKLAQLSGPVKVYYLESR